jgi:hypothetical protein
VPFFNPPVPPLYRHVGLTDRGCLGFWRTLVRFPVLRVAPTVSGSFWAGRDRSARVRATAVGSAGRRPIPPTPPTHLNLQGISLFSNKLGSVGGVGGATG